MLRPWLWMICWTCCWIVAGCGAASQPPRAVAPATSPRELASSQSTSGEQATATARKVIFTAQVDVLVDDLAPAQQRLNELIARVQQAGGYVSHQEVSGTAGSRRHGTWTLRVPQPRFEQVMTDLEQLGELLRSTRDSQDVTEAYTDLEARLKNKQSSEQRLLSHLEKTGDLKDTLEVERELSRVRGEVEQLQGQLNLLKHKTDLATIILTLQERAGFTPVTTPTFKTQVSRTFEESWQAFAAFLRFLVLFAVAIVPWLCLVAPVLVAVWLWKRRRRKANHRRTD